MRILLSTLVLFMFAECAVAQSRDRVRLKTGSSESGSVVKTSPLAITLEKSGSKTDISVLDVRSIIFDDEPGELTQARLNASNTSYEQALDMLGGINPADVRNPYVKQDIEFYTAFCEAKMALLGARPVKAAGGKVAAFVTNNRQSYHFLEATELLGDLLVADARFDQAQSQYEILAKTPWPSYQKRAGVLVGNALVAQKKYDEAKQYYSKVASIQDETAEGKAQDLAAKLGLAVTKAALGDVPAGISAVEGVIRDADPENTQLLAAAYNSLGDCHRAAGNAKDALFAYLHVDLLYRRAATEHAEALFHLATLWESIGQEGEARQARAFLKEQYAGTRWAKQLDN